MFGTVLNLLIKFLPTRLPRLLTERPDLLVDHALAYAAKLAATLPKDKILLVNLSGRGDKDMHTVAQRSGLQL